MRFSFLCLLAFILSFPGAASAQDTGSISGTITDTSGAVIPGATVTISGGAGLSRSAICDAQGAYSITGLPAGTYSVTISFTGFKEFHATGVPVIAGQTAVFDASLQPAGESASVNVNAERAAEVQTENAQITGTITQKEITSIGLNGRNFTQLIALAPGVSNQTGQDEAVVGVKGSVRYSVNGGRVEYNTFDVDNSDVLNAGINGNQSTLIVYPSLDAINEVKVLTSNYGAVYGRSASGTVLVTTKSGSQSFHGDAYEFIRNELFNARNFFDQTSRAPLYRRNDFGFTLGGPLFIPKFYNTKKDKTFFFFSEEVRLERTPQDFNQAVPSAAQLSGNFSDVCPFAQPGEQVLFKRAVFPDCPRTGFSLQNPGFDISYPGNQIPTVAAAASILSTGVIPAPNSTTGCNSTISSCYDIVVSPATYWREELFRIDHNFNQSLRASFRYIHDAWDTTTATPQWPFVANSFPTIENRFVGPGLSLVARLSAIVSPTFVNDVTVSYSTDHISLTDTNGPGATWQRPSNLVMGAFFNNGFGGKVPGIIVGGSNTAYGGFGFAVDPSYEPWSHSNPTVTLRDDANKSIGKHTLQFGAHFVLAHRSEINNAAGANTGDLQGVLTFTNESNIATTGNAFADLLAGRIRAFQQDSAQFKYYNSYTIAEPYFQDDWRVSSRLTLNLGLRVSLFGLWHEKYHTAFNWDPRAFNSAIAPAVDPLFGELIDPATTQPIPLDLNNLDPRLTNGIVRCGFNGVPEACMSGHLFNPAPRIGFAWDPRGNGKTSIRGGYGIFFHHGTGNEANTGALEGSPPLVLDMTQDIPQGYVSIGTRGGPVAFPLNVTAIPTKAVWPYVQQWSLSVQHQLFPNTVASVAYVGSKGTHLTAARQINQLVPVDPSQNPFQPGQPITLGICDTFDGGNFILGNTTVSAGQPGFVNLEAACFGTPPPPTRPNLVFPDPNALRTFAPGIGRIFSLENIADSNYHAFQFTMRRTQGPLYLDLAYSYSHSIDDSSDRFDATFVNSFDLKSNRASSNFDQRHLLNVGYVYELSDLGRRLQRLWKWENGPLDAAQRRFARGAAPAAPALADPPSPAGKISWIERQALEGWQISGLTTFQSGTPFSVINGGSAITGFSVLDNAGVANGAGAGSFPDIIGDPHGPHPKGADNALSFGPALGNAAAFGAPQGLTFGNAGRNSFNNPRRLNFDVALLKHFRFGESKNLEFRAEAFNIFNHTQFRIYNPDRGNTGTNVITCYGGPTGSAGFVGSGVNCLAGNSFLHPIDAHRPRTMQFGLKLLF